MAPSQLFFPVAIALEGSILTRSMRKAFFLSNMQALTLLVLNSPRIGNLSVQLPTMVRVLPTGTFGRQEVPLVSPDGAIHARSPHPTRMGSHLTLIHQILPLVPPIVNARWCRDCIGPYLMVQLMALGRLVLSFTPGRVRIATAVPRILALHGPLGVTFSPPGLGCGVHVLGLKVSQPPRGQTSVTG